MKPLDMLNQVKELLGVEVEQEEVKLAQMKLENGTVIEAESFENDQPVFIVTEDEKVAMPVGDYQLEDNTILVIEEEGIIKEIKEAVSEEEMEEEVEASEEISEELEEDEEKEEMKYVTKEELNAAVDEIKAMIENLRYKDKEEEMSEAEQLGLSMTEKLDKEESLELSETEKISHSPEAKVKRGINLYAKNRTHTTKDRVLNKILNFNN